MKQFIVGKILFIKRKNKNKKSTLLLLFGMVFALFRVYYLQLNPCSVSKKKTTNNMTAQEKFNQLAETVTAEIIAELENGSVVWKNGFTNIILQGAHNYFSGRNYEGFNQFYLSYKTQKNNYPTAQYISFKQANDLGGYIKKGEKSTPAIFWKVGNYATGKKNEVGEEETRKVFTPFIHYVFNIAQVDGIEFKPVELPPLRNNSIIDICASIVERIKHRGNQPAYSPILDEIYMPLMGQYDNSESYYLTLFHELIHSTGHVKRLNRFADEKNVISSFGSESYSKEELTAEMGAAQLSAYTGILTDELKENSVAYLKGWIKALKSDSTLLISAANKAGRSAKYILNLLETENPDNREQLKAAAPLRYLPFE